MKKVNWLDVMLKQVGLSKGELIRILENEKLMRSIQRKYSITESVEFDFDTSSDNFFKEYCSLSAVYSLRKRLAELLIITSYCLRYRKTDETLLERLIQNKSSRYNPNSYYFVPLPKYIVVED